MLLACDRDVITRTVQVIHLKQPMVVSKLRPFEKCMSSRPLKGRISSIELYREELFN